MVVVVVKLVGFVGVLLLIVGVILELIMFVLIIW